MILVDTSVWADHFRRASAGLATLLEREQVLAHPFVIGELALGRLPRRDQVLADLSHLPAAPLAGHEEVLSLVHGRNLSGTGIGWVDAHLLASVLIARARLWTLDARLAAVGHRLGVV